MIHDLKRYKINLKGEYILLNTVGFMKEDKFMIRFLYSVPLNSRKQHKNVISYSSRCTKYHNTNWSAACNSRHLLKCTLNRRNRGNMSSAGNIVIHNFREHIFSRQTYFKTLLMSSSSSTCCIAAIRFPRFNSLRVRRPVPDLLM